jgi:hypothetical protein
MKRWIAPAVTAGTIFVVNVIGRVIAEVIVNSDDVSTQTTIGIYGVSGMVAIALAAGVWWSVRHPLQRTVSELGLALLIATFASVLLGPLTVGGNPFGSGVSLVVAEVLMFFACTAVAAFVGFLATTVLGTDHRSRNLKRVEQHYGRTRR